MNNNLSDTIKVPTVPKMSANIYTIESNEMKSKSVKSPYFANLISRCD